MGSSSQAEIDNAGRNGAIANAYCRNYIIVYIGGARYRQGNANIKKADIRIEIDKEAVYYNPSVPI